MAKKTDKSFEQKMNRLKEIVDSLEKDDADLDESINLYFEGLKLSKELKAELNTFEDRVKEIGESNE